MPRGVIKRNEQKFVVVHSPKNTFLKCPIKTPPTKWKLQLFYLSAMKPPTKHYTFANLPTPQSLQGFCMMFFNDAFCLKKGKYNLTYGQYPQEFGKPGPDGQSCLFCHEGVWVSDAAFPEFLVKVWECLPSPAHDVANVGPIQREKDDQNQAGHTCE